MQNIAEVSSPAKHEINEHCYSGMVITYPRLPP